MLNNQYSLRIEEKDYQKMKQIAQVEKSLYVQITNEMLPRNYLLAQFANTLIISI